MNEANTHALRTRVTFLRSGASTSAKYKAVWCIYTTLLKVGR